MVEFAGSFLVSRLLGTEKQLLFDQKFGIKRTGFDRLDLSVLLK